MFAHDHFLNTQPTSFDGVKSSFTAWSKEVIAFLAVTDYQEFIPLLTAAASSKDVIQADVMFTGVLSDTIEELTRKNDDQVKKRSRQSKSSSRKSSSRSSGSHCRDWWHQEWGYQTQWQNGAEEINSAQGRFLSQIYSASCDFGRSKCHGWENHADVEFRFWHSHGSWKSGFKWQFTLKDQPKPGRCHCSSRSCHRQGGV